MIMLFIALFVVNLPALLIFSLNKTSYPTYKSTDDLNNLLFKTSFGNIGGGKIIIL